MEDQSETETMNHHVPDDIVKKYPNMVFRGKPLLIKDRTVIRAENPTTDMKFYYSFAEDFFWIRDMEMPDWKFPKLT